MSLTKRNFSQEVTILVAEPDEKYNQLICERLWQDGYMVKRCRNGSEVLDEVKRKAVSFIILSMRLSGMHEWALLKQCRELTPIPIIVLTMEGQHTEGVIGFRYGADDYMPVKRSVQELCYRIDAILRRSYSAKQFEIRGKELVLDKLVMDRQSMDVSFAGNMIAMTPIQFKLLWTLASQRNEVLPKPYLYRQVLEREYALYDRSLDMHLSRIRKKLIAVGMPADQLLTLHGKGYSFVS
ncbi:response regulator transcription factor [Photobacterium makurazakiensis]|uniref:response regulator transcription factor n=1 Tax=Photobacterium TaxID=657 RepID=UPI003D14973A